MESFNKIYEEIHLNLEPSIRHLSRKDLKRICAQKKKDMNNGSIFKAALLNNFPITVILQSRLPNAFTFSDNSPWIGIIADRYVRTSDVIGFHNDSLRNTIRQSDQVCIITSTPAAPLYMIAAVTAGELSKRALIIETFAEKKWLWVSYVMNANPFIGVQLGDD